MSPSRHADGDTSRSQPPHVVPAVARSRVGARIVALVCLAVLLVYLALYVFAANSLRKFDPETALKIAPTSSAALASSIDKRIINGESGDDLRSAAETAIRWEPLNTSAWRVLGLIEASNGNAELALRIISFANYLSRRDNVSNLWLIEQHLNQNDLEQALEYYDFALSSSLPLREQLVQRLAIAMGEREAVKPIADTLLRSPGWAEDFFSALNNLAPNGENVAHLIQILQAERYAGSLDILRDQPQRFVAMGQVASAKRIYDLLGGRGQPTLGVIEFVGSDPILPFDWELTSEQSLEASAVTPRKAGDPSALVLRGTSGQSRPAARRLLTLSPGEYALVTPFVLFGNHAPERLEWSVKCNRSGRQLGAAVLRPQDANAQTFRFDVPTGGCTSQWLELSIATGSNPAMAEIEVASPSLRRTGD